MVRMLYYKTPKERFEAWQKYKDLVDKEVERLEKIADEEFKKGLAEFENTRKVLNEMYHTQYELDKNMK